MPENVGYSPVDIVRSSLGNKPMGGNSQFLQGSPFVPGPNPMSPATPAVSQPKFTGLPPGATAASAGQQAAPPPVTVTVNNAPPVGGQPPDVPIGGQPPEHPNVPAPGPAPPPSQEVPGATPRHPSQQTGQEPADTYLQDFFRLSPQDRLADPDEFLRVARQLQLNEDTRNSSTGGLDDVIALFDNIDLSDRTANRALLETLARLRPDRFDGNAATTVNRFQRLEGVAGGGPIFNPDGSRRSNDNTGGSVNLSGLPPGTLTPGAELGFGAQSTSSQNAVRNAVSGLGNTPIDRVTREAIVSILEKGPYVDMEQFLPAIQNVRETWIENSDRATKRLMANLAARGFGAGSDLQVAALKELETEVASRQSQEVRELVSSELDRSNERFVSTLEAALGLQVAQGQLGLGYASLRTTAGIENAKLALQERFGITDRELEAARISLSASLGEADILLRQTAQSQSWQQFMLNYGLAEEQFNFAQEQALNGNVAQILQLLISFLNSTGEGYI